MLCLQDITKEYLKMYKGRPQVNPEAGEISPRFIRMVLSGLVRSNQRIHRLGPGTAEGRKKLTKYR